MNKIGGFFFFALLIVPSLVFCWLDQRVLNWDEAFYGSGALIAARGFSEGAGSYFHALTTMYGTKAPLIGWFAHLFVPLKSLFPRVEFSFSLAQNICLAGSFFIFTRAVKASRWIEVLLAALVLASMPYVAVMSHLFFAEVVQMFGIVFFLWVFLTRNEKHPRVLLIETILAVFVLMAAKISSPVYVFVLGLNILATLFTRRSEISKPNLETARYERLVIGLTMAFGALVLAWHIRNIEIVLHFARSAASGDISLLYGTKAPFTDKWSYWTNWIWFMSSGGRTAEAFQALIAVGLVHAGFSIYKNRSKKSRSINFDIIVVVLQVLLTLALFSTQVNQETRYVIPLLPLIAFVLYRIFQTSAVLRLLTILVLVFRFVELHGASFDAWPDKKNFPFGKHVNRNAERRIGATELIHSVCISGEATKVIVGSDLIDFNADTFSFMVLALDPEIKRCQMINPVHASTDVMKTLGVINQIEAKKAVFPSLSELKNSEDAFNRVSLQLYEKLLSEKWTLVTQQSGYQILSAPKPL